VALEKASRVIEIEEIVGSPEVVEAEALTLLAGDHLLLPTMMPLRDLLPLINVPKEEEVQVSGQVSEWEL